MPSQPITSKQQQWLEHVKAADTGDGSLTDYVSRLDLSVKTLYQWKSKLIQLGGDICAKEKTSSGGLLK